VLVDFPTLQGRIYELANGTVISPGALLPLLDEAFIERAVYRPDNRVEVSETARLFTGATRRAIELRDRECTHPYCDGSRRCEVDHIIPYVDGGPTTQENGRLLCSFHNRLRNQRPPPPTG
jgi:5-methylcytosine-specific restriction endonuclease McrA